MGAVRWQARTKRLIGVYVRFATDAGTILPMNKQQRESLLMESCAPSSRSSKPTAVSESTLRSSKFRQSRFEFSGFFLIGRTETEGLALGQINQGFQLAKGNCMNLENMIVDLEQDVGYSHAPEAEGGWAKVIVRAIIYLF
jgi:hypothetical protein